MKKIVLIALLVFVLAAGTASALALGLSYGLNVGEGLPENRVMMSARFDGMPFLMGLGFSLDPFTFGFTADYILYRTNLVNFLNLYAGPGGYLGIGNEVSFGLRVPVALYVFPIDPLELFLEFAPTIGINLDTGNFPEVGLQSAVGFRFHF